MYYVIVPQEVCERRKVFTKNKRTPDGRVVLTLRDLNMTRFSYGPVEIVNDEDLKSVMSAKQGTASNNQTKKEK
jgi:hypothetical protein